jgi:hypothetical protein
MSESFWLTEFECSRVGVGTAVELVVNFVNLFANLDTRLDVSFLITYG